MASRVRLACMIFPASHPPWTIMPSPLSMMVSWMKISKSKFPFVYLELTWTLHHVKSCHPAGCSPETRGREKFFCSERNTPGVVHITKHQVSAGAGILLWQTQRKHQHQRRTHRDKEATTIAADVAASILKKAA